MGTSDFYPRSPCGERLAGSGIFNVNILFLSTLSLRRATALDDIKKGRPLYFYPRSPCGERRAGSALYRRPHNISIHALLAESDALHRRVIGSYRDFYPRSPCGERPGGKIHDPGKILFLSTLSLRRATIELAFLAINPITFLSTLSLRRATPQIKIMGAPVDNFYPRSPCGERRFNRIEDLDSTPISIHALLAESDIRGP